MKTVPLLLLLALAACGGDGTAPEPVAYNRTVQLVSFELSARLCCRRTVTAARQAPLGGPAYLTLHSVGHDTAGIGSLTVAAAQAVTLRLVDSSYTPPLDEWFIVSLSQPGVQDLSWRRVGTSLLVTWGPVQLFDPLLYDPAARWTWQWPNATTSLGISSTDLLLTMTVGWTDSSRVAVAGVRSEGPRHQATTTLAALLAGGLPVAK